MQGHLELFQIFFYFKLKLKFIDPDQLISLNGKRTYANK